MSQAMRHRLESLLRAASAHKQILILPHNDPDPDAIASAVALRHLLAQKAGVEGQIVYEGLVGRAENKALVQYLGRPMRPLSGAAQNPNAPFALIDTQPGAGNNTLPPDAPLAIVIDHHPEREETAAAAFADIRADVGATSTMLTEYFQAAGLRPPPKLATALFYGIKTDSMGLSRGASPADAAAYFFLQPQVDVDALVKIERAQVPPEYFRSFAAALQATRLYDGVVVSYAGSMDYPDLAAEMADLLTRLEGTQWVICMGAYQDVLYLSVRSRQRGGDAGRLVQTIVAADGSAGGHGAMAGGQVPLRGQKPEAVFGRLNRRTLEYLGVDPEKEGKPLL